MAKDQKPKRSVAWELLVPIVVGATVGITSSFFSEAWQDVRQAKAVRPEVRIGKGDPHYPGSRSWSLTLRPLGKPIPSLQVDFTLPPSSNLIDGSIAYPVRKGERQPQHAFRAPLDDRHNFTVTLTDFKRPEVLRVQFMFAGAMPSPDIVNYVSPDTYVGPLWTTERVLLLSNMLLLSAIVVMVFRGARGGRSD